MFCFVLFTCQFVFVNVTFPCLYICKFHCFLSYFISILLSTFQSFFLYLYVCMFLCFYVCFFICMFACFYDSMFLCLFLYLYNCMFLYLYICMSLYLFLYLYVSMFVYLFVCLHVCASLLMFIASLILSWDVASTFKLKQKNQNICLVKSGQRWKCTKCSLLFFAPNVRSSIFWDWHSIRQLYFSDRNFRIFFFIIIFFVFSRKTENRICLICACQVLS